jgi:hypothetical protein
MGSKIRTVLSAVPAGLLGAAISGLAAFALNRLQAVYPPLNLGNSLAFAMLPAFLASSASFFFYARFAFDAGWFFGGLAGAATGIFAGIGNLLSYDRLAPDGASLVFSGFAGGLVGGGIGAILGAVFGPVLAGSRRMR